MFRILDERGDIIENCTCQLSATAERLAREWSELLGRRCFVVWI